MGHLGPHETRGSLSTPWVTMRHLGHHGHQGHSDTAGPTPRPAGTTLLNLEIALPVRPAGSERAGAGAAAGAGAPAAGAAGAGAPAAAPGPQAGDWPLKAPVTSV